MTIAIVFNPGSGRRASVSERALAAYLSKPHDETIVWINCHDQPGFEAIIAEVKDPFEAIIAIGGDGTLNGVINGIQASIQPTTPVAFIPVGRGRDTARSLPSWQFTDLPYLVYDSPGNKPADLLHIALADGTIRYAINVCSVGLSAHAARIANRLPRIFGSLSYSLGALRSMLPLRTFLGQLDDDQQSELLMVAVCNGKSFGGGLYIAPEAAPCDGLMDVVVVKPAWLPDLIIQMLRLRSTRPFTHRALSRKQTRRLEFAFQSATLAEADGEVLSALPVRIKVAPQQQNWILP